MDSIGAHLLLGRLRFCRRAVYGMEKAGESEGGVVAMRRVVIALQGVLSGVAAIVAAPPPTPPLRS